MAWMLNTMDTIASTVFTDSDEEYDPDYIPEEPSDSGDEDAKKSEEHSAPDPETLEADRAIKDAKRASLWAEFQSSIGTNSIAASSSAPKEAKAKLVKVLKKYRFAGEEVSEIVEVAEESEDAKRWPLWKSPSPAPQGETKDVASRPVSHEVADGPRAPDASQLSAPVATNNDGGTSTSTAAKPAHTRPGPRKPKTLLAPLPSGKPKKLTTLEKSEMDWRAHISRQDFGTEAPLGTENLADELERNRKSGGYLEKVAFLDRVGNRREELYEESRKRRRKA